MRYNVSEFRYNIREILNDIKNGEQVIIQRYDEQFEVKFVGSPSPIKPEDLIDDSRKPTSPKQKEKNV